MVTPRLPRSSSHECLLVLASVRHRRRSVRKVAVPRRIEHHAADRGGCLDAVYAQAHDAEERVDWAEDV
jgi:hypothetical protein